MLLLYQRDVEAFCLIKKKKKKTDLCFEIFTSCVKKKLFKQFKNASGVLRPQTAL